MIKNITDGAVLVFTKEGKKTLEPNATIPKKDVLNLARLLEIKFVNVVELSCQPLQPTVEELEEIEVPENAEEITVEEAEQLKEKAEEQGQPIIEEKVEEVKEIVALAKPKTKIAVKNKKANK